MAASDRSAYWKRTRGLMLAVLAFCVALTWGVCLLAPQFDQLVVLGFPLGFYMTAQGLPVLFVVILFWLAHRQNAIDEEHEMD